MGQGDKDALIEMGFPEERAVLALARTGNLAQAVDWLGDPANENATPTITGGAISSSKPVGEDEEEDGLSKPNIPVDTSLANSLRCAECGKLFKSTSEAEYHAEKSGHDNFEESTDVVKALTAEEKAARLAELKAKAVARKAELERKAKLEDKANIAIRKKNTDLSARAIEQAKINQQKRDLERDRQQKKEDLLEKQRIKKQIEADRQARKEREEQEKLAHAGDADSVTDKYVPTVSASTAVKKSVTDSRLQIRPEGIHGPQQPIVKTYALETTLFEIAQSLTSSEVPTLNPELAVFSLTYPRKRYAGEDLQKTLRELGLSYAIKHVF